MKIKSPTTATWLAVFSLMISIPTGLFQIRSYYDAQENLRIIVCRELVDRYKLIDTPILNSTPVKGISSDWNIYVVSTSTQVNTVVTDLKILIGQTDNSGTTYDSNNLPTSGNNQLIDEDGQNIQFPFQVAAGSVKRIRVKDAYVQLTDKEIKNSAQAQPVFDNINMPEATRSILKMFFVDPFGLKGVYDGHVMQLDSKQDDIVEPCITVTVLTGRNEVKHSSGYWYDTIQYRAPSIPGKLKPSHTLKPYKSCAIPSF